LVAEIAAMIESERAERPNAGNYGEGRGADMAGAQLPAVAFHRVVHELESRIADLQASLEHERAQSVRLSESLQREQNLRALSAPEPSKKGGIWHRIFARNKS
jgi:hypothetical protein